MALRKIGKYYYAYFRDENGKLHTLATGQTVESEARKVDAALRAEVHTRRTQKMMLRFCRPDEKKQIIEAEAAAAVPAADRPAHNRGTIRLDKMLEQAGKYRVLSRSHRSAMSLFISRTSLVYADQVTPAIARDYLEKYYGNGNGKSYNNQKTYLNTIFRLLLIESGLESSPFASLVNRRVKATQVHRPLTEDEFRKLFYAAPPPFDTALLIGWHTGLRLKDCFTLTWDEITPDEWIRRIPAKTARYKRAVEIPIHPELAEHLKSLPHKESRICAGAPHKTTIIKRYRLLFRECGINDTDEGKASFHSLRSSFITRCDEAGIPRHATRGAAGQRSDQITDVYSHDKVTPLLIRRLPSVCKNVCKTNNRA